MTPVDVLLKRDARLDYVHQCDISVFEWYCNTVLIQEVLLGNAPYSSFRSTAGSRRFVSC